MQFLIYLFKAGRLTAEQVLEILEAQLKSSPPVGKLALQKGALSIREVSQVLRFQSDSPGLRFGEMAVEQGLLTEAQVADLLREQHRQRLSIDQILIESQYMEAAQLTVSRQRYRLSML